MSEDKPVYVGMPASDRTFTIDPWGNIRCGGKCKDDYRRIEILHNGNGEVVKLQHAALNSFQAAQDAVGSQIHLTGIGWRSCASQATLYASDPSRFAPPDGTAHTRGLAIDVSQAQPADKLAKIHRALTNRGWHQARSDEPWHYSAFIQV